MTRPGAFQGVYRALLALILLLLSNAAWADSPGDIVAKLVPGGADAPAKALAEGTFDVEQLGAELDLLRDTAQLPKVAETLHAVQKAAGWKYWSDDYDLVAGLVALPEADADAYRAVLGTACILRALAKDGSQAAVSRMILVVPDHGGALRFEVARRVKALGEKAIAPLILARGDKRLRGFAWSTLDSMGKKIPGDAVQTRSNDVLAAVLGAYGTVKDMDALGVVMSFVGSEHKEVRDSARAALLAYGDLALPKLRETLGNVQAPPPSEWKAEDIARALFDILDKQRHADLDALVEEGLAESGRGDFAAAARTFDKVLARAPTDERRALMAPAYAELGFSLEDADRAGARAAFERCIDLDPTGLRGAAVRAELAVMDGEDLLARGITDREPFERALSLDPANTKARAALDRMDDAARDRESRLRKWKWAGAAGAAFVVLLVLFGRVPRRRRSSE